MLAVLSRKEGKEPSICPAASFISKNTQKYLLGFDITKFTLTVK
jgi:hypothetical protein